MSRKKTEINPIRAERVKLLISREHITQTEFAERIDMTQQNISRIVQLKQPLTEETARRIIGRFPDYRIEWLLGYDDAINYDEWAEKTQYKKDIIADGLWGIIEKSLNKMDKSLRFIHPAGRHYDSSQRLKDGCYYSIVDRDGNELKHLTALEVVRFEEDLQEYCDFLIHKLIKAEEKQHVTLVSRNTD